MFSLKKKIKCLWSQSVTVSNEIWDILCFEYTKKITFTKSLQNWWSNIQGGHGNSWIAGLGEAQGSTLSYGFPRPPVIGEQIKSITVTHSPPHL